MTQLVVWGGGRGGAGWEGATGSSQRWLVGQPVHSSLLPPTMASVASDGAYYGTYIFRFISKNL
jgi:hypothetical protein